MSDDKRFLRRLKREIKQAGQRKLRRYLKNVDANADDFDYGRDRSDIMNEQKPRYANRQSGPARAHTLRVGRRTFAGSSPALGTEG